MTSRIAADANSAGITALIVEDHEDLRELLRATLEHYGLCVVEAASAGEALALLEKRRVNIIISDIGMPEVDGVRLLREVRSTVDKQTANLPAIALTAYIDHENRSRAMLAGFDAYMTKPFDAGQLMHTVRRLVQMSHVEATKPPNRSDLD